jgi:hypothetical protein
MASTSASQRLLSVLAWARQAVRGRERRFFFVVALVIGRRQAPLLGPLGVLLDQLAHLIGGRALRRKKREKLALVRERASSSSWAPP